METAGIPEGYVNPCVVHCALSSVVEFDQLYHLQRFSCYLPPCLSVAEKAAEGEMPPLGAALGGKSEPANAPGSGSLTLSARSLRFAPLSAAVV